MTSLQEDILFAALVVMALVWLVCVTKLAGQLRDRHAEKYEQMRLADMWPRDLAGWIRGHNNARPVFALLRFLLIGEDAALRDAGISSLSTFLRWLFFVYLCLFLILVYSFMNPPDPKHRAGPVKNPVEVSTRGDSRREQAFNLHRAQKWAEAIAVYDELLRKSEPDAELSYWRGMAHWKLNNAEQALQDFRSVIELEPTHFNAHRSADRILSQQGRWDEILEMWDRYIGQEPANAEAYFERGGTNYRKGNLAAAQADAAKACELGKSEACTLTERLKSKL